MYKRKRVVRNIIIVFEVLPPLESSSQGDGSFLKPGNFIIDLLRHSFFFVSY